jgi:hypothetical protein
MPARCWRRQSRASASPPATREGYGTDSPPPASSSWLTRHMGDWEGGTDEAHTRRSSTACATACALACASEGALDHRCDASPPQRSASVVGLDRRVSAKGAQTTAAVCARGRIEISVLVFCQHRAALRARGWIYTALACGSCGSCCASRARTACGTAPRRAFPATLCCARGWIVRRRMSVRQIVAGGRVPGQSPLRRAPRKEEQGRAQRTKGWGASTL